jgi:hypothetical protein
MEVEKLVGAHPETNMIGNIPYTPRVKKVLVLAGKEAKGLNHRPSPLSKRIEERINGTVGSFSRRATPYIRLGRGSKAGFPSTI